MKQKLAAPSLQFARLEKRWEQYGRDAGKVNAGCQSAECYDSTSKVPLTVPPLLKWQTDGAQMGKEGRDRGSAGESV